MLDIQNDERKASEKLINHEICNSKNCVMHMEENTEYIHVEKLINFEDSLNDFEKKEEEHAIRQAERNTEVQNINKKLALKENLASKLLNNKPRRVIFKMMKGKHPKVHRKEL